MEPIIGASATADADLIKDATVETFEADVLAASMEAPVIVDFWAEWCGPCKQLAPLLEKAVRAAKGAVRLVKVDIDKNQMLASQLRIQSIPTVYAFFQGRPVDGFQGALPESEIKAFIDRLTALGPSEGGGDPLEAVLDAGDAAREASDLAGAMHAYAQVLQADPGSLRALAGAARVQLAAGEPEQARATFEQVPEDKRGDPLFAGIDAALALAAEGGGDVDRARAAAQGAPADLQAQFDFALALIGAGRPAEAIEPLLAIIERDREWSEDAARKKLLQVFDALGPTDKATVSGRRRLSSILFS